MEYIFTFHFQSSCSIFHFMPYVYIVLPSVLTTYPENKEFYKKDY
jgi:hypothetical protein